MEYKIEKKEAPDRGMVDVLGPTYEKGKPEGENAGSWRYKLRDRGEKLRYIKAGERYW
ncbi:MAG TPA: hypothetical protein G4O19_00450 [Dehalococcoidia bacterium]|nr:hypothetical protein [Dehalococcoidia bacterium]